MDNSQLQALLGAKVLELSFVRRHKKLGWSNVRALLGTTNYKLLNGDFGKQVLQFIPPKGVGMGYDYKAKGLCVVWDMMRQEYRIFGSQQVSVRQQWDLSTEEDMEAFEKYFYENIINMSSQDKLDFMGYLGPMAKPSAPPKPNIVKPTDNKAASPTIGKAIKDRFSGFFKRVSKWFTKH